MNVFVEVHFVGNLKTNYTALVTQEEKVDERIVSTTAMITVMRHSF
jgi:hypothetical protein